MGGVVDFIFGDNDAKDDAKKAAKISSKAQLEAAEIAAGSQTEALDYLKEREALPQSIREGALSTLAGIYGIDYLNPATYGTGGIGGTGGTAVNAPANFYDLEGWESGFADYGAELRALEAQLAAINSGQQTVSPEHKTRIKTYINYLKSMSPQDRARSMDASHGYTGGLAGFDDTEVWETGFTSYDEELRALEAQLAAINSGQQTVPPEHKARIEAFIDHIKAMSPEERSAQVRAGSLGYNSGQQELIDRAMNSPLYQALMGGQELGEEAIMRNAAMTGGLRSGNVQGAMYDYDTQLQNQALLQSYNEQLQGITGLAGLGNNQNAIAQAMSNIGTTQAGGVAGAGATTAQGIIAGANAEALGNQNAINNLLGLGQLGIKAGTAIFSDRRLKKNITLLGKVNDFNFYSFKWNKIGNALGLEGKTCGCMAEEVYDINPKAVILKDGFMFVNYSMIGVL